MLKFPPTFNAHKLWFHRRFVPEMLLSICVGCSWGNNLIETVVDSFIDPKCSVLLYRDPGAITVRTEEWYS